MNHRLNIHHIEQADRIKDFVVLNTPKYRFEPLEEILECHLADKLEFLTRFARTKEKRSIF